MTSVERTKATEGLVYLNQVQQQQERHLAQFGRYATTKRELTNTMGESLANPNFFSQTKFSSSDWEQRWSLRLTRDSASSGFGRYTIAWNQDGFVPNKSSIPVDLKPDGGGTAQASSSSGSVGTPSKGSDKPPAEEGTKGEKDREDNRDGDKKEKKGKKGEKGKKH